MKNYRLIDIRLTIKKQRKAYKIVKIIKKDFQPKTGYCKDKDENIISNETEIKKR